MANSEMRKNLRRILREGNNLIGSLVSQVLLELAENDTALNRLDEIGRKSKQV